jgi:hypothetical protein
MALCGRLLNYQHSGDPFHLRLQGEVTTLWPLLILTVHVNSVNGEMGGGGGGKKEKE